MASIYGLQKGDTISPKGIIDGDILRKWGNFWGGGLTDAARIKVTHTGINWVDVELPSDPPTPLRLSFEDCDKYFNRVN